MQEREQEKAPPKKVGNWITKRLWFLKIISGFCSVFRRVLCVYTYDAMYGWCKIKQRAFVSISITSVIFFTTFVFFFFFFASAWVLYARRDVIADDRVFRKSIWIEIMRRRWAMKLKMFLGRFARFLARWMKENFDEKGISWHFFQSVEE